MCGFRAESCCFQMILLLLLFPLSHSLKGDTFSSRQPAGPEPYLMDVVERSLLSLLLVPLVALIFLLVWKVS